MEMVHRTESLNYEITAVTPVENSKELRICYMFTNSVQFNYNTEL
jgi:hypothetical protein